MPWFVSGDIKGMTIWGRLLKMTKKYGSWKKKWFCKTRETNKKEEWPHQIGKICYLMPTTTVKSSSRDRLMYFWKSNLLLGVKWVCKGKVMDDNEGWMMGESGIMNPAGWRTHRNEAMAHGQVICLTNRPEELAEEANLQKCEPTLFK